MRRIMLKKIVPEQVLPQNIVDFLVDEKAELAEIDAFTFFKRLRDLGVGSADFIYLLEGCGAPEEAVLKIKSNPAMNLQGLIRTVESAGMTSKDYMRILYTARRIWEHTLTSRLDMMRSDMRANQIPEENDDFYGSIEDPDAPVAPRVSAVPDAPAAPRASAVPDAPVAPRASAVPDIPDAPDDLDESDEFRAAFDAVMEEDRNASENEVYDSTTGFSLGATEELESLLKVLSDKDEASDYAQPSPFSESEDFDAEIADSDEIIGEYIDEQNTIAPASPEDLRKQVRDFTVEIDYNEENSAAGTAVKEPFETSPASGYNGDTTAIFKIDRTMLEENLANIARNAGAPDPVIEDPDHDDDHDEDSDEDVQPIKRRPRAPINDQYDDDYDYIQGRSRYYAGALSAASIGAVAVLGFGVAAGILFGMEPVKPIGYAADENEIFTEIRSSYEAKIAGGDSFYRYSLQDLTVFGDLLIERESFGTFTDGDNIYTLTSEQISVNEFSEGSMSFVGTITPPENTVFADVSQLSDGAVIAAFDGECCGYMKISDGKSVYTVKQDGSLTDFRADDSEVRIGSVYTPKFYNVVKVTDKEIYLPKMGVEYTPIEPQKVIPSRTPGYSYGVSGTYSAESGVTMRADAVLGNPVYASGDGVFAVNSAEAGMLLRADHTNVTPDTGDTPVPKVITLDCGKLVNAAFYQNGSAIFENGSIVIRDREFNTQSMLQNLSSIPEYMSFSGNTLLAADKDKVFLTVDCADLINPAPVQLKLVRGKVGTNRAVTIEQNAEGIRTASYKLDGSGKAVVEHENTLPLNGEQRGTLKFGGTASMVAEEGLCGAAYSYFDGVSVISEYVLLGSPVKRNMLYDDKTGFDMAFISDPADGRIYAHCANGLVEIKG